MGARSSEISAFVALGSNLGDRLAHLQFGLHALEDEPGISVVAASAVYETAAVGPPQGAYLNACLRLETRMPPRRLLDAMLAIEARAGRVRDPDEQWAPRTLDLDLLLYGEHQIDEPGLEIPHPRLAERPFVLIPLVELAPEQVHPPSRRSIAALAAPHRDTPDVQLFPDRLVVSRGDPNERAPERPES